MEVQVSFLLAFVAGVVSFLSPCILPVVPSYVAFVSGMSLAELTEEPVQGTRRRAVSHSILFMMGFGAVFMTMGTAATATGAVIAGWLPWINRAGGLAMIAFGLHLMGALPIPALLRERRLHLDRRPAGALGSFVVGLAFGAGWTPCIGPILGSILLYAGLESTRVHGTLLLGTYALGLGIPFVAASAGLDAMLTTTARARRAMVPLQRAAGTVLLLIGLLMASGKFASLTAFLAGMGQLINLDV